MLKREITIGKIKIGGTCPIAIQTMWKDKLEYADLESARQKIEELGVLGCDLLRFAVPDIKSAEILGELADSVSMPLVADIHFDYKIALRCMDFPIAKIRINPGNIGTKEKTAKVLEKASFKGIPIRIGINAGSLPLDLRDKVFKNEIKSAEALVQTALREISIFKEFNFDNYLISMKASNIADNIEANKILSEMTDVPLHLGVTEAGPLVAGVASTTAAMVNLLSCGIGDTIRVSLSDTMENEVIAAREILRSSAELMDAQGKDAGRLKRPGVKIVSCPRCARHGFDTHGFTAKWMPKLYGIKKDITVAIMGCEVNGPTEAKHADIGITGAKEKVLIFKKGKIIKTINAEDADKEFEKELNELC